MKEELEITSLGNFEELEYGIDQHKNIYSRLPGKPSWEIIFEYRRKPKTRSSSEGMTILAEISIFSFAIDSEGNYWKKMKDQLWTEFGSGIEPPKYYMQKIIATKGNHYWVQERKNKTIVKYRVNIENQHHIKRSKKYYDFIHYERRKKQTKKEKIEYEKAYLDRKKAKEELYNKYFVLK